MDLHQIVSTFKSEREYHNYLINKRWPNGISCPFCNGHKIIHRKSSHRLKCKSCNHSFSSTSGTVLHATRLPLSKWFMAISIVINAKKGVSSLQLARTIGVSKNTAWYMQMRLRKAMKFDFLLDDLIEIEEYEIGGEPQKVKSNDKLPQYISEFKKINNSNIVEMKLNNSTLIAENDKSNGVSFLKPLYCEKQHFIPPPLGYNNTNLPNIGAFVSHHLNIEYEMKFLKWGSSQLCAVREFLTTMKRAILGQYHSVNPYNMILYMNEINFKFNHRKEDLFALTISRCMTEVPFSRKSQTG